MFFASSMTEVYAAMTGRAVPLDEVDEPFFRGKVVGDGMAIIPEDGMALSPVSGIVSLVGKQKHTYGITGYDGVEILLHIGIDTVKLDGRGFEPQVKEGDKVQVGDLLCKADLELLKIEGFDPTSPLIITSSSIDKVKRLVLKAGPVKAGQSVCMRYKIQI